MAETSKANAFPQFKSTPTTKRSILGPMFDDEEESEYSFVHPYGDKRVNIKRNGVLDRLSNNLKDVTHFGQAVRLHLDQEVKKRITRAIEEDYESDSSNERISKSKTINYIIDKATVCAGNIRTVAGEINEINPCGDGALLAAGGDSYDDSKPQQRQKTTTVRKKKASEAGTHDGIILGYLSDSDEESFQGSESTWSYSSSSISSSSYSSYESNPRSYTSKLRPKKQQFIQRHGAEKSGNKSRVTDKSFGDGIQQLHTQEMRPSLLVSNPKHQSFVPERNATDGAAPETSPTTVDSNVIDVSNGLPITLNQLSWESKETTIVMGSDQARDFLTTSHIGPVLTKITSSLENLQLGDVIVRFNGEDVSTLEGEILSDLLIRCKGKRIRITYLRKTMLV